MKTISRGIKFVYFDVGGVLLGWEKSLVKLAEKHHKSPKVVRALFDKYDLIFSRGTHSARDMTNTFKKELDIKDTDFEYVSYCSSEFVPILETHALVHELKNSHKIGLLTNLHTDTFDYIMRFGSVPNISYSAIIKSYEVGYVKPEPEIYHIAQKRAGVAPHEILFIDDMSQNILAAQKLGWQGHVFDKKNPKKSVTEIKKKLNRS